MTDPKKIPLKVHRHTPDDVTPVLSFKYRSGPEMTENLLIVGAEEYGLILGRVLQDVELMKEIARYWEAFGVEITRHGGSAKPPSRKHYARFLRACDPEDASRAALISMLLSEGIEIEVVAKLIDDGWQGLSSLFEPEYVWGPK